MIEMLYIIYPNRNCDKLMVYSIPVREVEEYAVASRHSWAKEQVDVAISYAKELANKNGLTYVHNSDLNYPNYLD